MDRETKKASTLNLFWLAYSEVWFACRILGWTAILNYAWYIAHRISP